MARKKKEKEERKKANKKAPKKPRRKTVRKRPKKKPKSSSSQGASGKKQHHVPVCKKPKKSTGLDSACKKTDKKAIVVCPPMKTSKKAKPDSGRKELEKKPVQHSDSKKTDMKAMAERKEGKKTNVLVVAGDTKGLQASVGTNSSRSIKDTDKLTRETRERMKELRQDGVIILIDQPNLEIGKRNKMKEQMPTRKNDKKDSWVIRYGRLKETVAKAGPGSEPRIILKTCVVTSRKSQATSWNGQKVVRHGLSRGIQKRHDIEYLVSPVPPSKGSEKSVDAMVVRRMVEEYAALEIFRLQGMAVPKRTFCLFTADADFVDVAKVAREKGFDVELWFFEKVTGYSEKKWAKATGKCETGECGGFRRVYLEKYEKKISKMTNLKEDRDWSTVVSE